MHFFTIMILSVMNDNRFDLDSLHTKGSQSLKITLSSMAESVRVCSIQRLVDNFAKIRQTQNKEKIGEIHSIT